MKLAFDESKSIINADGNIFFECYSASYVFSTFNGENISISFSAFSEKSEFPVLSEETENEVKRRLRLYDNAEDMLEMLESLGSVDFDADALEALCRRVRGLS